MKITKTNTVKVKAKVWNTLKTMGFSPSAVQAIFDDIRPETWSKLVREQK